MTEQQIADIKVRKIRLNSIDSGGAYRIVSVEIGVDCTKTAREQRISATHEVLGAYLGSVVHIDDIGEIATSICDVLEQLKRG